MNFYRNRICHTTILMLISPVVLSQELSTYPASKVENGWQIIDPIPSEVCIAQDGLSFNLPSSDVTSIKQYPVFQTSQKLTDPAGIEEKKDAPWREWGLDIRDAGQAQEFALKMQAYVYDGFFEKSIDNPEFHFDVKTNNKRLWCHTPWLNITSKGREFVHGLTKEFPINPSPQYPNIKKGEGTSWGAAYFNAYACQDYEEIFGDAANPKSAEDVAKLEKFSFQDGYVSFKILFNNSPSTDFEGAYTWTAHIGSTNFFNKGRALSKTRHIQMDIAIKDSRIIGSMKEISHWVMLTYAFDPSYQSPLSEQLGLPDGIKNMRPIGIQYGLGAGESVIFKDAKTNHCDYQIVEVGTPEKPRQIRECTTYPEVSVSRLNGPADDPTSSCLGCHAAAGTDFPPAPGMMKNEDYAPFIGNSLDFNQQVRLAREYVREMIKK